MQKYYQSEPKFTVVYSRDNLPKKIKDAIYVINLDEYADVGNHWIALYVLNIEIIYSYSSGVEHIPKENEKIIGNKNIKTNIFRIQADEIVMCGYIFIGLLIFCFYVKH